MTEDNKVFFEIEKKFLLKNDSWKAEVKEYFNIEQGYLVNIKKKTIRVRKRVSLLTEYFLTIKCSTDKMGKNIEIEKPINETEYVFLLGKNINKLQLIKDIVSKDNKAWEINEVNIIEENITKKETKELNSVCKFKIQKVRSIIVRGKFKWEIDEFIDHNKGLVMAEIEFLEDDDEFEHPEWLGEEVTEDKRYYNFFLSQNKII